MNNAQIMTNALKEVAKALKELNDELAFEKNISGYGIVDKDKMYLNGGCYTYAFNLSYSICNDTLRFESEQEALEFLTELKENMTDFDNDLLYLEGAEIVDLKPLHNYIEHLENQIKSTTSQLHLLRKMLGIPNEQQGDLGED